MRPVLNKSTKYSAWRAVSKSWGLLNPATRVFVSKTTYSRKGVKKTIKEMTWENG